MYKEWRERDGFCSDLQVHSFHCFSLGGGERASCAIIIQIVFFLLFSHFFLIVLVVNVIVYCHDKIAQASLEF